jgi:hypothetical protein
LTAIIYVDAAWFLSRWLTICVAELLHGTCASMHVNGWKIIERSDANERWRTNGCVEKLSCIMPENVLELQRSSSPVGRARWLTVQKMQTRWGRAL